MDPKSLLALLDRVEVMSEDVVLARQLLDELEENEKEATELARAAETVVRAAEALVSAAPALAAALLAVSALAPEAAASVPAVAPPAVDPATTVGPVAADNAAAAVPAVAPLIAPLIPAAPAALATAPATTPPQMPGNLFSIGLINTNLGVPPAPNPGQGDKPCICPAAGCTNAYANIRSYRVHYNIKHFVKIWQCRWCPWNQVQYRRSDVMAHFLKKNAEDAAAGRIRSHPQ
ncbi:hypothetical protein MBM_09862 [Drepanopeziza brunnea f. sp. 'multigermtubi' MB_m1]|uniref:Uncharacterized protein n=1 Tax=Marssonina brunnea f. sp. multigermtubi (strain MB_m1) TaxID=1072389 RepID=K1XHR3_MARBU|nr:uncharacterized protein MBM_09862 [Drepanopeziza brunnea f. sp. 'multigermtubi' MB_m1]EKD11999.1 hypothetical protein MBM_09862 [Drepanopeziza brunnea f. sp. 'multigermtubi' MB_m1]